MTENHTEGKLDSATNIGMGPILICKYREGFCLWPSRVTDSIKNSLWKEGRGVS
jgi:hypothetical protein